jgi:UDP-3-O-[3-hydroxymyristoyl] glucosamine N-acyltransferase
MYLSQIKKILNLDISITNDIDFKKLNSLEEAKENEISFLQNKKYLNKLKTTKAGAILVNKNEAKFVPKTSIALIVDEPYVSLAILSKYFATPLLLKPNKPKNGKNVTINKNAYIGANVSIGDNSVIFPNVFIGDNVTIGKNSIIYPNVTIYKECIIGNNTIIHSGSVIGSDGFGFATDKNGNHIKIYQNGNVIIGDDVEIGSNCTIDRAAFNSTIIEDKVRIDNLVHIAHNCKIGKGSILVTQTGLSGSTILGEYVVMAGQSGTTGHLTIAPFTTISARGVVSKSITTPNKQWAGFPLLEHKIWLKLQSKIKKLLS